MKPFFILAMVGVLSACVPSQVHSNSSSPTSQLPDGAELFGRSCAGCHQGNGSGIEEVFPPLAGHVGNLLKAEGGREYLAKVILFGLQGPIQVSNKNYNGRMPAFAALEDAQIASLLNHISRSWGNAALLPSNFQPYSADNIAALRSTRPSVMELLEQRSKLNLQP